MSRWACCSARSRTATVTSTKLPISSTSRPVSRSRRPCPTSTRTLSPPRASMMRCMLENGSPSTRARSSRSRTRSRSSGCLWASTSDVVGTTSRARSRAGGTSPATTTRRRSRGRPGTARASRRRRARQGAAVRGSPRTWVVSVVVQRGGEPGPDSTPGTLARRRFPATGPGTARDGARRSVGPPPTSECGVRCQTDRARGREAHRGRRAGSVGTALSRALPGRPQPPLATRLCQASATVLGARSAALTVAPTADDRLTVSTADGLAARIEGLGEVIGEGPVQRAPRRTTSSSAGPTTAATSTTSPSSPTRSRRSRARARTTPCRCTREGGSSAC